MQLTTLAFLVIVGMLPIREIEAWERTALKNCLDQEQACLKNASYCTQDYNTCRQQQQDCKIKGAMCKKDAENQDEFSFSSSLSTYYYQKFQTLTPEQKKMAMDNADHNRMTPDDGVAKVLAIPRPR